MLRLLLVSISLLLLSAGCQKHLGLARVDPSAYQGLDAVVLKNHWHVTLNEKAKNKKLGTKVVHKQWIQTFNAQGRESLRRDYIYDSKDEKLDLSFEVINAKGKVTRGCCLKIKSPLSGGPFSHIKAITLEPKNYPDSDLFIIKTTRRYQDASALFPLALTSDLPVMRAEVTIESNTSQDPYFRVADQKSVRSVILQKSQTSGKVKHFYFADQPQAMETLFIALQPLALETLKKNVSARLNLWQISESELTVMKTKPFARSISKSRIIQRLKAKVIKEFKIVETNTPILFQDTHSLADMLKSKAASRLDALRLMHALLNQANIKTRLSLSPSGLHSDLLYEGLFEVLSLEAFGGKTWQSVYSSSSKKNPGSSMKLVQSNGSLRLTF